MRFRALSASPDRCGYEALCLACFRITRKAGQSERRCRDVWNACFLSKMCITYIFASFVEAIEVQADKGRN